MDILECNWLKLKLSLDIEIKNSNKKIRLGPREGQPQNGNIPSRGGRGKVKYFHAGLASESVEPQIEALGRYLQARLATVQLTISRLSVQLIVYS